MRAKKVAVLPDIVGTSLDTGAEIDAHPCCAGPLYLQIRDLEREFGLNLFERVGRRLVLTGEGAQLLEKAT